MKKSKIIIFLLIIVLIIGNISAAVLAAEGEPQLLVVQKESETKNLENAQGNITKTIVDSNSQTGEVTIELKLQNTSTNGTSQTQNFEETEIYIMLSEDIVIDDNTFEAYKTYVNTLASKIYATNSKTKIGIIGIKGTINDITYDEDGTAHFGENHQGNVDGTEDNAEIIIAPTDNLESLETALANMNPSKTKYYKNLQAAIRLANNSYSENVNKILISLYSNPAEIAIGECVTVSAYESAARARLERITSKTKEEFVKLQQSNIEFILLKPDDDSYNAKYYSNNTGELLFEIDGTPYIRELYGTLENPTYGKMYSLQNDSLETIVNTYIYNDVMEIINPQITNVKIEDYFPQEIIEHFDFSYVGEPSIGTVDSQINPETRTISWNIGTLESGETATLRYTLKIKDMNNQELLEKTLSTNERVVLTYNDSANTAHTITLENNPKIKLSEENEPVEGTDEKPSDEKPSDNTTSDEKLPNTGKKAVKILAIILIAIAGIYGYNKYKNLKEN